MGLLEEIMLTLALLGCSPEPTEEMLDAVVVTNDLISSNLVAAESASFVAAEETRDGFCPSVSKDGGLLDFTVLVDYGEGCTPTTGLVPYEMSGALSVAYASQTLDVTFDELTCEGASVDGTITGSYAGASFSDGVEITLTTDIEMGWLDWPVELTEDFTAGIGPSTASLEGTGSLVNPSGSYAIGVTDLEFDYVDVWATCPLPNSGTIDVDVNGVSVSVTFDEDSPDDGTVEVSQGKKSVDIPLCDYVMYL